LMVAVGVGVLVRWKDTPGKWLAGMLTPVLILSAVLAGVGCLLLDDFQWAVLAVCLLSFWVVLTGVRDLLDKTRHTGLLKGITRHPRATRSYWGMALGNLAIAVCAVGIGLSTQANAERDLRMAPGDLQEEGGYQFVFDGAQHHEGPNYTFDRATVSVLQDGRQ